MHWHPSAGYLGEPIAIGVAWERSISSVSKALFAAVQSVRGTNPDTEIPQCRTGYPAAAMMRYPLDWAHEGLLAPHLDSGLTSI